MHELNGLRTWKPKSSRQSLRKFWLTSSKTFSRSSLKATSLSSSWTSLWHEQLMQKIISSLKVFVYIKHKNSLVGVNNVVNEGVEVVNKYFCDNFVNGVERLMNLISSLKMIKMSTNLRMKGVTVSKIVGQDSQWQRRCGQDWKCHFLLCTNIA